MLKYSYLKRTPSARAEREHHVCPITSRKQIHKRNKASSQGKPRHCRVWRYTYITVLKIHTSDCRCIHTSDCRCIHTSDCRCIHTSDCRCIHTSDCRCIHTSQYPNAQALAKRHLPICHMHVHAATCVDTMIGPSIMKPCWSMCRRELERSAWTSGFAKH